MLVCVVLGGPLKRIALCCAAFAGPLNKTVGRILDTVYVSMLNAGYVLPILYVAKISVHQTRVLEMSLH